MDPLIAIGLTMVVAAFSYYLCGVARPARLVATMLCLATIAPLAVAAPAGAHTDDQWPRWWAGRTGGADCQLAQSMMGHDYFDFGVDAYRAYKYVYYTQACDVRQVVPQHWLAIRADWWLNGDGNGGGFKCAWINWWYNPADADRDWYGYDGTSNFCGLGYYSVDEWQYEYPGSGTIWHGLWRYNAVHHAY